MCAQFTLRVRKGMMSLFFIYNDSITMAIMLSLLGEAGSGGRVSSET